MKHAVRFGLDVGELELNARELMLIVNALNRQRLYSRSLALKAVEGEARGRNIVNALELEVLIAKVKGAGG